jgi:hypothetical protein
VGNTVLSCAATAGTTARKGEEYFLGRGKWSVNHWFGARGDSWVLRSPELTHATTKEQIVTDPKYAAFTALDPFFDLVQQGLAGLVDGDHYFDTIADDAAFEFRYHFPGWPQTLRGRDALMALVTCCALGKPWQIIWQTRRFTCQTTKSVLVLRWICGVKPKPKPVNKPSHHCIMHGLDKPGVFTTVSTKTSIRF